MDVGKGNIFEILNGQRQYQIPVYQRLYSWDKAQCERLWDDIVAMQNSSDRFHFIGSIVNIAEKTMPTGIQKYLIIDGQQRMTTLSLLLIALRDFIQANPGCSEVTAEKLENILLKNPYEKDFNRYKLLLTASDRDYLIALIEKEPLDGFDSSRLKHNYDFFYERIEKGELTPDAVYESIGRLLIVNITLEQGKDDPQAIFESLNSTGKALSESDLIRNYILMGLPSKEQSEIYLHRWHPMEKLFTGDKHGEAMDRFFRDFLTMKLNRIPKVDSIYAEFKDWRSRNSVDVRAFCSDIYNHAKTYTDIIYGRNVVALTPLYKEIVELRMEVSYPLLLQVHEDWRKGTITEYEVAEILKLSMAYILRRSICGIPTNSLNKTFATFSREAKLDAQNSAKDYLDAVKAFYILLPSYKAFPTDEEFTKRFIERDIYHMRVCRYILQTLEWFNNKNKTDVSNKTIEHIMPQNPNPRKEWRVALGANWQEDQKTWVHTIGNLTLTNFNSEMGDLPFKTEQDGQKDKLTMEGGFLESALRLNRFIIKQNTWNADLIQKRAEKLKEIALEAWPYPSLSEEELAKHRPFDNPEQKYSLNNYPFKGADKVLYDELDKRIMNLSPEVNRQYNKLYIAYKLDTNFVDVIVQQQGLRLSLNMPFDEINDPHGVCINQSAQGHWANGDVRIDVTSDMSVDMLMSLIEQSYRFNAED